MEGSIAALVAAVITSIHLLVAVAAFGTALMWAIVGTYVVPRLSGLAANPSRLIRTAQWATMLFCFGSAWTHTARGIHTLTGHVAGYGDTLHITIAHLLPHTAQLIGGGIVIWIVHRHLDLQFRSVEQVRLEHEKDELLARLKVLATRDHLTGLLNRRAFDEELAAHERFVERYGANGGVIYLDIDGFKQTNDTLGHKAGDRLLRQTADVLSATVRGTDVVGRLGGDEFGILLRQAGPRECEGVAERIVAEIARLDGGPEPIRASVGVACCLTSKNPVEDADAAMYVAKRAGGGRYVMA